jgi:hypothetical protein
VGLAALATSGLVLVATRLVHVDGHFIFFPEIIFSAGGVGCRTLYIFRRPSTQLSKIAKSIARNRGHRFTR